ncbi:hypothetical protein Tco_0747373 [Tanacetum coccineum]|uniref:Uncharacterized protein n=1 Tax=Tanacetum coccineum TaxID=301880 RepID=A0ABQ4YVC5_9ASTR
MRDNPQLQQDDLPIWLVLKYKFERLYVATTPCRPSTVRPKGQDDPHDDAHHERENSAKRQKTSEYRTFVFGESSSGQDYRSEPDDDELPTKKVSQELVDEISQTVDEARLRKVADEMLRQLCTLRDGASITFFIRTTVIWERVHDLQLGVESYQQKVNLTAPTITFPGIEKFKVFFIVSEPVYGIIYKNNNKEKRVIRHQEVHKFCDATLKRVLEGLKSYNNDVKHGYVTPSLSNKDVEYLQLFEEEIEERLKHRDQMRRWQMYVNGRPLGSRRERPE